MHAVDAPNTAWEALGLEPFHNLAELLLSWPRERLLLIVADHEVAEKLAVLRHGGGAHTGLVAEVYTAGSAREPAEESQKPYAMVELLACDIYTLWHKVVKLLQQLLVQSARNTKHGPKVFAVVRRVLVQVLAHPLRNTVVVLHLRPSMLHETKAM